MTLSRPAWLNLLPRETRLVLGSLSTSPLDVDIIVSKTFPRDILITPGDVTLDGFQRASLVVSTPTRGEEPGPCHVSTGPKETQNRVTSVGSDPEVPFKRVCECNRLWQALTCKWREYIWHAFPQLERTQWITLMEQQFWSVINILDWVHMPAVHGKMPHLVKCNSVFIETWVFRYRISS